MNAVLTAMSVMRKLLLTPIRIAVSIVLGGLFTLIAIVGNVQNEELVDALVLGGLLLFVVPIVSLVFAVGALGDTNEDGTLVYLWLKPLPRWQLGLAAVLATWQLVVPITMLMGALLSLLGGQADRAIPAAIACGLASMAYSTLFVGLGLRTTRSLLAGLIFVLIWEGFLSALSEGIATISVRRWSSALYVDLSNVRDELGTASAEASIGVLLVLAAVGLLLTSRWLGTRDVP